MRESKQIYVTVCTDGVDATVAIVGTFRRRIVCSRCGRTIPPTTTAVVSFAHQVTRLPQDPPNRG